MKAKYILIVVAVLLLPTVVNAQTRSTSNTSMRSVSNLLDDKQYVQPVQQMPRETVVRPTYGHHTYGNTKKGISVDSYTPIQPHYVGVGATTVGATYVAASVDNRVETAIQSVSVALPKVWKGNVATVGADVPVGDGRVKRRADGLPGEDFDEPGTPAPLGDVSWWLMMGLAVGYVLIRRRQTIVEK